MYSGVVQVATVVRSVRLTDDIDEKVAKIAKTETRPVSNTLTWLIGLAVDRYLAEHPDIQ